MARPFRPARTPATSAQPSHGCPSASRSEMTRPRRRLHLRSLLLAALALGVQARASAASDDDELEVRHLWPLLESSRQPDGKHVSMLFFYLYHRTTNGDGSTYSWNVLNYLESPDFSAFLPLYYRWGAENEKSTLVIPFWLQGPGYGGSPLLCSGGWTRADGGHSLWITPLFHWHQRADGTLEDGHFLTWFTGDEHTAFIPFYFSGPGWWTVPPVLTGWWRHDDGGTSLWITPLVHGRVDAGGSLVQWHVLNLYHDAGTTLFFPLAWYGGHEDHRNVGLLPLLIKHDQTWCSPLILSGTWPNAEGGRTSWLTPLAHMQTDRNGRITAAHLLNYIHAHDLDAVLPLAWWWGPSGSSSGVVLPAVLWGPDWWLAPLALSGGASHADGSATVWVTPLYHRSIDGTGRERSWHLLTAFASRSGGGVDAHGAVQPETAAWGALPFYYHRHKIAADGSRSACNAFLPVLVTGPDYWVTPVAASWDDAAGNTTSWVTPLAHLCTRSDGSISSLHVLTWAQGSQRGEADEQGNPSGSDYHVLFPFYYQRSLSAHGASETYQGVPLLWMQGPETIAFPLVLSFYQHRAGQGSSLWATPLFHLDQDQDGTPTSWHAGPVFSWGPPAAHHVGIFPLWFHGPDSWVCPPALSLYQRAPDGSSSTWITPLVHISKDRDGTSLSITPFYYDAPGRWVVPLALSGHWTRSDAGASTWLTPLFHVDSAPAGGTERFHVLNWVHGKDYDVVLPLAWWSREPGSRSCGLLPLWVSTPRWWIIPVILTGGHQRTDGGHSLWITPLFHRDTDAEGTPFDWHALIVFHHDTTDVLLPLAWRSGEIGSRSYGVLPLWISTPRWWISPVLLSGGGRRDNGGCSLWVTPLFHRGTDANGTTTDWHALNVISHGDTHVVLPLYWQRGPPGARTVVFLPFFVHRPGYTVAAPFYFSKDRADGSGCDVGVIPLFVAGPDYWVAPLLLSGHADLASGRSTTVVTPFYHRTTQDGELCHMHLLTYIATPDVSTAFPLYWDWNTAAARHVLALPFYYQSRGRDGDFTASVLPALFSYHAGPELDTSIGYQLIPFVVQNTAHGWEVNLLWRLLHVRDKAAETEVEVGPLWWSEHHRGAPTSWQVLGGLVARSCNYQAGTSRLSMLWGLIPLSGRQHFGPASAEPASPDASLH
jgi:hypothetical protein